MTDLTPHAIKSIDLAGFSNFTLEDLDWVDGELGDGRVSRVHSQEAHAGGMSYYGARGVRLLDPSAKSRGHGFGWPTRPTDRLASG